MGEGSDSDHLMMHYSKTSQTEWFKLQEVYFLMVLGLGVQD
jgi:hypothetical protein